MNTEKVMIAVFLAIGLGIFFYFQSEQDNKILNERIVPIKKSIIASNRPRVITFTAAWCPACQQFKPILKKVMADYAASVDCQIVDTENKQNADIMNAFSVRSIPATFIFDRQGNLITKQIGLIEQDDLDQYLRKAVH